MHACMPITIQRHSCHARSVPCSCPCNEALGSRAVLGLRPMPEASPRLCMYRSDGHTGTLRSVGSQDPIAVGGVAGHADDPFKIQEARCISTTFVPFAAVFRSISAMSCCSCTFRSRHARRLFHITRRRPAATPTPTGLVRTQPPGHQSSCMAEQTFALHQPTKITFSPATLSHVATYMTWST